MTNRDVAIVGMACLFPKAPDLAAYWRNICGRVDAISEVPAGRWDPRYYDPESSAPDRFYAKRGGFIDDFAQFDAAAFGIMPVAAQGAEPDQLLALKVAVDAIADAGYAERPFARERASVIIGRGNYVGPGILRLINITRGAQQLADTLHELLPDLSGERLAQVKQAFQARCGVYGADSAIGLVPNLTASRIANRLDLGGSAYTVDAACASTLVAVEHACRALRSGESDLAIAGGVHLCHDLTFWSVFSQLGALSRNQQIRPFDRRADGLLIGEGVGMLVLRRLADARRDDDRIYAVIRGVGVASDGRDTSLMTPRVAGQILALERAWGDAELDRATVGLVEAHGTATPAGDSAELRTLARFFGPVANGRARVPLGSVKSMIGHAMPAAGAAGLIKAALAVYHGVRPPTLHCEEPSPALEPTRFRPIHAKEAWDDFPHRAAVNAFGFGGINAHVIVDAPVAETTRRRSRTADGNRAVRGAALVIAAPTQALLLEALDGGFGGGGDGPWRLVVIEPTPKKRATARQAVETGRARHGRDGIYFSPAGLVSQGGKLALLFPGVEAAFAPAIDDVAAHFGIALPKLEANGLAQQGFGVIRVNDLMHRVAGRLGIVPDMIAGHSIGEWSGMHASGMFGDLSAEAIAAQLNPDTLQVSDVTYVAVGAGAARAMSVVRDLPDVFVSHDNCVHQSILCAPDARVDAIAQRLREQRVLFEVLPFRSGFHSPALAAHVAYFAGNFAKLSLQAASVPLWSATTCTPYPSEPAAITALFSDHLTRPVRFRELVQALHADGVRVFVQAGAGSLGAFVDDVLTRSSHHAVSLVSTTHAGMAQIQRACAALWVEGVPIDLVQCGLVETQPKPATRALRPLELGVPLIRLDIAPLDTSALPSAPVSVGADPVLAALTENLRAMADAQTTVARAFAAPHEPAEEPAGGQALTTAASGEQVRQVMFGLDTFPELVDHCLIPQPPGWPSFADRLPVVPMTMSIALMLDAARQFDPGRVPVAIENVLARSWLRVPHPIEVSITARRLDAQRIHVRIGKHVEGTVTMAEHHASPPAPSTETIGELQAFPINADAVYRDHWLFHGPRYQGLVTIDGFGANGISGTLRALPAKGALLDAAGQQAGLWITMATEQDRMALPIRVGRVDFYGPDPAPGEALGCKVWIRRVGRNDVRADLELVCRGRVWATIAGWEDYRFQTGDGIFDVLREPGTKLLAAMHPDGFALLTDPGWTSATFENLGRRFLSTADFEVNAERRPQRRRDWLLGRIAAKDAVRKRLFDEGVEAVFPVQVDIVNDAAGRPRVSTPYPLDLRVSIAHTAGVACAMAAIGVDPGVDIERIEARSDAAVALAFDDAELARLPDGDRDEWLTRLWCAKEAAGKARGTGIAGNPKGLPITAIEGERVRVDDRWIGTRRIGEHVVAWTIL